MLPISNALTKSIIDTEQQFDALRDARQKLRKSYSGGMHWKNIKGTDYLYRTQGGKSSSLGPRSSETEQKLENFLREQKVAIERVGQLSELLVTAAKINVVYRAGHVPNEVADVCIQLDEAGLLLAAVSDAARGYFRIASSCSRTSVRVSWRHWAASSAVAARYFARAASFSGPSSCGAGSRISLRSSAIFAFADFGRSMKW